MGYVTDATWQRYKDVINNFRDDIGKQTVVWRRTISRLDRYQEGIPSYEDVLIEALVEYPFVVKWPIDRKVVPGQIDEITGGLYLNLIYLKGLGYLDDEGRFMYDPGRDRFYFEGFWYKSGGTMQAAQAKDEPLYLILLLERDNSITGGPDIPI